MNKPYELTAQEWEEVAAVREVAESFGLEDEADPAAWLAEYAYGVRFDYQTDGPGYVGPLYILKGAGAAGTPAMMLVRGQAGLKLAEGSFWLPDRP